MVKKKVVKKAVKKKAAKKVAKKVSKATKKTKDTTGTEVIKVLIAATTSFNELFRAIKELTREVIALRESIVVADEETYAPFKIADQKVEDTSQKEDELEEIEIINPFTEIKNSVLTGEP